MSAVLKTLRLTSFSFSELVTNPDYETGEEIPEN